MNRQSRNLIIILALCIVGSTITLIGCKVLPTATLAIVPAHTPPPTRTPHPIALIENQLTPTERLTIFNAVWQTINDEYYDPTFGGKDWQAIGDKYRQRLEKIEDDTAFWLQVLNPMLFELGVSHLVALPPGMANELDRMTFATGSLGLDVRLLDGLAVVTQVVEGSPADEAGLRPGFVLTSVDGWTLEDLTATSLQTPPYNERHLRGIAIQGMRSMLFGETGKAVVVEYLDDQERPQSATLQFTTRIGSSCDQLDPATPPACGEIEVRHLANDIGYIRFSGFLSAVQDGVLQAIEAFHDAPALIIDLRGNPGGEFLVRKAIASQLVGRPDLFIRYQYRDHHEEAYLDPVTNPYPGKVVILVDEHSTSSSEEFSGSLQVFGRATIVGSQTPGVCLVMNIKILPYGTILAYPIAQSQVAYGRVLENNGVVPDTEVVLHRAELLQGRDNQLEAALNYLKEALTNPDE